MRIEPVRAKIVAGESMRVRFDFEGEPRDLHCVLRGPGGEKIWKTREYPGSIDAIGPELSPGKWTLEVEGATASFEVAPLRPESLYLDGASAYFIQDGALFFANVQSGGMERRRQVGPGATDPLSGTRWESWREGATLLAAADNGEPARFQLRAPPDAVSRHGSSLQRPAREQSGPRWEVSAGPWKSDFEVAAAVGPELSIVRFFFNGGPPRVRRRELLPGTPVALEARENQEWPHVAAVIPSGEGFLIEHFSAEQPRRSWRVLQGKFVAGPLIAANRKDARIFVLYQRGESLEMAMGPVKGPLQTFPLANAVAGSAGLDSQGRNVRWVVEDAAGQLVFGEIEDQKWTPLPARRAPAPPGLFHPLRIALEYVLVLRDSLQLAEIR